ncbi:TPR repeat-containing protein [Mizugakiibacter sediminis]|uniref:TPR repeat-containing protein n=1 Tax=Mizugakiibacter sediminis TaxID=1475481 RepID=A0A0K8QKM9_9GAMM|nr:sulfotransferase [Mizugakiibacter sediminis]GAP65500.1 TPR repeat-containing protein [Mizugakiibacter sediminis]
MDTSAADLWTHAQRLLAQRRTDDARRWLQALVAREPGHAAAHAQLGGMALARGRLRAAAAHALTASAHLPADADVIGAIAQLLYHCGESRAAMACLQHPAIAAARDAPTLQRLAGLLQMLGDQQGALSLLDRARDAGADSAELRYARSLQLTFCGRLDEAEAELRTCLARAPALGRAWYDLARLRRHAADDDLPARIRANAAAVPPGSDDHAALEFALFKAHDDLDQREDAWTALMRGCALKRARVDYDAARERALFDALVARCDARFLAAADAPRHDGPTPIFIVGLPRSGTTLLERVLAGHSQVAAAGELPDWPRQLQWAADHRAHEVLDGTLLAKLDGAEFAEIGRRYLDRTQWRAGGKAFYVDKLPSNFLLAGFIHRALPHAPIVHLAREPLDACFAILKTFFPHAYPYSYAPADIAAHYAQYRRLMAHWHAAMPGRILDVSYRALVEDPAATAAAVLAHCGLALEPACLAPERNPAAAATPSGAQVRAPIHRHALRQWRRYETPLAPLRTALAPWLDAGAGPG